jgi:outer membrane protein TolC
MSMRTMNRALARSLVLGGALLAAAALPAQQRLSLDEAVALAARQSFPSRAAVSTRDAARARDRAFGATLMPQVSLSGNLPVFNRSIIPVLQPDGSTLFRPQQQNESSLNMQLTQRVPWTGSEIFVSSALSRLEVIGERDTRNWSSTPFSIGIRQPIMRPNTTRWDAREQSIRSDVAERQYLEAREDLAVTTTNAFFDYFAARVALDNAVNNAAVNDTLYTLNQGRFEVGRIGENDLLQSELALLRSRTTLDGARLEHDRTLAALRLALNLPSGTPLEVVAPTDIPLLAADTAIAVTQAMRNRALIGELELSETQAKRRVSESKYNTGLGATVQASMGFNQSGSDVDLVYRDLREAQRFSIALQMPLVQWGGRSAQIEAARADQDRVEATARASREQAIQDAHFAALQLAQSARQLALAAKGDTVGAKRFEVAKNRYVIGRIGIDNLYQAQNEKDQALAQYVASLRGYWVAYYRLRRLTLFDFEQGMPIR